MTPHLQLVFAWGWMLMGLLSGVALGLGFHKAEFMGGYDGWRRRLARLGHIAFFGTGLLNLFSTLTWKVFAIESGLMPVVGWLLLVGAAAMPTVCLLSAWRKPFRHLFPVPVVTLVGGVGLLFYILLTSTPGGTP